MTVPGYLTLADAARRMRLTVPLVRQLCMASRLEWLRSTARVDGRSEVLVSEASIHRYLMTTMIVRWSRPRHAPMSPPPADSPHDDLGVGA